MKVGDLVKITTAQRPTIGRHYRPCRGPLQNRRCFGTAYTEQTKSGISVLSHHTIGEGMQVGNLVRIARCEDDNRGKLALVLEMFCPPNIWKIQIIGEDTYRHLSSSPIGDTMQIGDLVEHNGSGPVGWKMKGAIGLVTKHEDWTCGGEWRILWVSKWVTEWYRDVLWFGSELEVISENGDLVRCIYKYGGEDAVCKR